jgi:hypothetical protein
MSVNTSRSISDISDTQALRLVGNSPINDNSNIALDIAMMSATRTRMVDTNSISVKAKAKGQ